MGKALEVHLGRVSKDSYRRLSVFKGWPPGWPNQRGFEEAVATMWQPSSFSSQDRGQDKAIKAGLQAPQPITSDPRWDYSLLYLPITKSWWLSSETNLPSFLCIAIATITQHCGPARGPGAQTALVQFPALSLWGYRAWAVSSGVSPHPTPPYLSTWATTRSQVTLAKWLLLCSLQFPDL